MPTGSASVHSLQVSQTGNGAHGASIREKSHQLSDLPVLDGIYHIQALEQYPGLLHGISTRRSPDGKDWNLSAKRGTPEDPPSIETARTNRRKLADALGISPDSVVGCQQVHGVEVALVGAGHSVSGLDSPLRYVPGVDALITNAPDLYLIALAADCPPVFFYDPVRCAVGLAHSGWKGTVGRIAANVVEAMVDNFGSSPSDIVAAIGPGIGPCCYAVGQNVVEAVDAAFPGHNALDRPLLRERDGSVYFNLAETIRHTLLQVGLQPENITVEDVCTAHNLHTFYSHRGEAGRCGLFGAVLGLNQATL